MKVIQALFGIIFLLPGLCSAATILVTAPWTIDSVIRPDKYPNMDASAFILFPLLWGVCFLVSWVGWRLLRNARKSGKQGR